MVNCPMELELIAPTQSAQTPRRRKPDPSSSLEQVYISIRPSLGRFKDELFRVFAIYSNFGFELARLSYYRRAGYVSGRRIE